MSNDDPGSPSYASMGIDALYEQISGLERERDELRALVDELAARLREAVALLESYDKGKAYIPEFKAAIAKAEA